MTMIELGVAAALLLFLCGVLTGAGAKLKQALAATKGKQEALTASAEDEPWGAASKASATPGAAPGPSHSTWTTAAKQDTTVSGRNNMVTLSGSPKRVLITGRYHTVTVGQDLENALIVIDASDTQVLLKNLFYSRVVIRGNNVVVKGNFHHNTVVDVRGDNCKVRGHKDTTVIVTVSGSRMLDTTEDGVTTYVASQFSRLVPVFKEELLIKPQEEGSTQTPAAPAEPTDPAALRAFFMKRINKVLDAYGDYCCKPEAFLSHPLLNDSSDPRTAAFTNAHGEIMDAGDLEKVPLELLRLLSEKLSDTWTAAWEASDRRGYNALEGEQADAARQAVGAWALSQDESADPAFRENALAIFHRKVEAAGLRLPKELRELTAGAKH